MFSIVTETVSPGCSGPTPAGVPGEDHVTGQQRHGLGDVGDQLGHRVEQVLGAPGLSQLAVDRGGHREVGAQRRVGVGLDPGADRAERVEALGPPPLLLGLLQVAGRDVVGAGIAEDDVGGPLDRHLAAEPADDHGELTLVVDVVRHPGRILDRLARTDHRRRGLEERDRRLVLVAAAAAHLLGVLGVVAPDRDDLARQHRSDQPYVEQRLGLADDLERRERVTVDAAHRQPVEPASPSGLLAFDDAEGGPVTSGIPRDAHPARLPGGPGGQVRPWRSRP